MMITIIGVCLLFLHSTVSYTLNTTTSRNDSVISNSSTHNFVNAKNDSIIEFFTPTLWINNTVPYTFSYFFNSFAGDSDSKTNIIRAMKEVEDKTCIRFVERVLENDYVKFIQDVSCSSPIGRRGGEQLISLSTACLENHDSILHEIMHALGFAHEHMRHDRDNYITINWQNIKESNRNDINWAKFNRSDLRNYNTSYDFASVLHYARELGDDRVQIEPKQSGNVIKSNGLSRSDIYKINQLYACSQGAISAVLKNQVDNGDSQEVDIVHYCKNDAYYCGFELKKMNFQNVLSDNFLYYCNNGKILYHTNCQDGCVKQTISHCACVPNNKYCGHKLFLMNWGKKFETKGMTIYKCTKRNRVMETYTCHHVCLYSDNHKTSHCSTKFQLSVCTVGAFYCGYELAKLKFIDTNTANLYRCETKVDLYPSLTKYSGIPVKTCENGCIEDENGDSFCSSVKRVAYPKVNSNFNSDVSTAYPQFFMHKVTTQTASTIATTEEDNEWF